MVNFGNKWDSLLKEEFQEEYYQKLRTFLITEYRTKTIYPDMYHIFEAMKATDYDDVKVVILGQDPYHEPNQAHGMAFSVQPGVRIPPSLFNIYKELSSQLGLTIPNHGYLMKWAKQGVLLLNAVLTVERGKANSHKNMGWEQFTDRVIQLVNAKEKPVVFLLWGSNAIAKAKMIDTKKHLVLTSPHPSPLSAYRGFFGNGHFLTTNEFLKQKYSQVIDWQIDDI
ncbi:uracil-DNA glycosylase [Filifactor alocis ATCC 35896]|uniref:Uracil-DNA glycosylase n=1 Tax=Filifactor alocis (strain ATCC 35896 / CCUG 47790 / D40 B5) TaxID=546269 RepID=D6GR93_FILAD|nr:uracil-DNA glycosylase [Filifactor alocis]EFE28184.1 uracil-DNA glycosylase [Filifactor alocis ATCC 35896]